MIKIGYVINNLQVGGAEILLLNFIRAIDKKECKVYVYTLFKENPLKEEFLKSGARIRELNMKNNRQFWKISHLSTLMKSDELDIVHTHLCDADLYGRIAGQLAGIKIIVSTEHSINPWKFKKDAIRMIRNSLDRYTTKFCKTIICVSRAVGDFHIKWGIPKEKIRVIYHVNPFMPAKISKISKKRELGILRENFVITTVGRIVPLKNQKMLIECGFKILSRRKNITFLIIGDGPLRLELITYVKHSNYQKHFLFLGNRHDVNEILYISDVFVLPSIYEGFPQTIVEAMQQGLPVVASLVGGVPEIVDNTTGILIDPANPSELTNALYKLYKSGTLRKQFGLNAQKIIEKKFRFSKYVNEMLFLYNNLISNLFH